MTNFACNFWEFWGHFKITLRKLKAAQKTLRTCFGKKMFSASFRNILAINYWFLNIINCLLTAVDSPSKT